MLMHASPPLAPARPDHDPVPSPVGFATARMASLDVECARPTDLLAEATRHFSDIGVQPEVSALANAIMLAAQAVEATIAHTYGDHGERFQSSNPAAADALKEACSIAHTSCGHLATCCSQGSLDQCDRLEMAVRALAPAVLRLAVLVLTDVRVHGLLAAQGAHAAAADHVHSAVKELMQQLPPLLAQRSPSAASSVVDGSSVTLWEAVQVACVQLKLLATGVAGLLSAPATSGIPNQLRSFSVLNTAWASIIRLVSQLKVVPGASVFSPHNQQEVLGCALSQLTCAVQCLSSQCDSSNLRIVKFWLQCVVKLVCAWDETAARGCWHTLLASAIAVYTHSPHVPRREDGGSWEHAQHIQELVLPRVAACLLAALCHAGLDASEAEARLHDIICTSQQEPDSCARVLLVLELLLRAPSMGPTISELTARLLLPWVVQHAAATMGTALVCDQGDGVRCHVVCSCLAFMFGAAAHAEAWHLAMCALHSLALNGHVLIRDAAEAVLLLSGQLMPPAHLLEDFEASGQLLAASASLDALTGTSLSAETERLMSWCGTLMAALPNALKSQAATSMLRSFHKASNASIAAVTAVAWSVVAAAAPEAVDRGFVALHLDRCVQHAHEALSLAKIPTLSPSERWFVELHLGWMLACMTQALPLMKVEAEGLASPEVAAVGAFVVDAIRCAAHAATPPDATEAVPMFLGPAMETLAVVGAALPPNVLHDALACVQSVPYGESCALAVACALAHVGTAQEQPTELFHRVLCAPSWPVAQAAMRSLVCYCRSARTSSLAKLVPVGMRTADGAAAKPQFVQVYASHMKGEPDSQAVATFGAMQPQLLQQYAGIMASAAVLTTPCHPPDALAAARACVSSHNADVGQQALHEGGNAVTPLGQLLAPLLADAKSSIAAVLSALAPLESSLQALATGARYGAPQAQPQDVVVVQRAAGDLAADLASALSRIRSLQDHVAELRP